MRGRLRDALLQRSEDGSGARPFCAAPSASLYLDQRGDVRACCQNAGFPLGNVTESSLREIWDGHRTRRLREAVAGGDLSLGCNFCRWQVEDGSEEAVFARTFDHLRPDGPEPRWPQQLELSMSNACNLQCVMCNGEWSSSIRTHREGLPPLPTVYDDDFFEELAAFLPHLEVVKFLGGEPFLGKESLRVMEMLAELDSGIAVHVTTNGTQWSPRIERILDRLDVHVVVSLDGVHRDTYESIRVGSSFDQVMANIDRFVSYCSRRGTSFSLSHCLMTSNWDEFDDFLAFAEARRCPVFVNTVTEPYELSLYHLPPSDLREVVGTLERRGGSAGSQLSGRRLEVAVDQLARLRQHLESLETHRPPAYIAKRRQLGFAWLAPPERARAADTWLDQVLLDGIGWLIRTGSDGSVITVDAVGGARPLDEAGTVVAGLIEVGRALPAPFDGSGRRDDGSVVADDLHEFRVPAGALGADTPEVFVARVAVRDGDGIVAGSRVFIDGDSARAAAVRLAGSAAEVAGIEIDRSGRIRQFVGPIDAFTGVDSETLLGRPIGELESAVSRVAGAQLGPVEDRGGEGRVHHQVRCLRDSSGQLREIHSFSESSGPDTTVWLALTGAAVDGTVE